MRRAARRSVSAVAIGEVIAGRYRVVAKLGEGGMAEVFRADDLARDRVVAVKVLHPEVATNPEAVERTKREGQLLSELNNPAIVDVETYGELEDGTVFLVMELLEGETLGERMRRGPLEPAELAPIVAGTCAGLHAAHARGIVHRDLKPDNLFLCPTSHGIQVKLLDFGISKVYAEQKLTQTGEVLGTPRYMSPEQLGAEPDVDPRVDVYALGVILYEALAGKPPFLAGTPTDLIIAILNGKVVPLSSARPDVPQAVEAVVMRAMSRTRDARFDTAMALAEAYIDAIGGVSAVRSQQRRGVATRAMGGMRVGASAPPPSSPDPVAGKLAIGTFSGLADDPGPATGTRQMGAVPGAPVPPAPRPIPTTSSPEDPDPPVGRPIASTRETPMGMPDAALPSGPRSVAATAAMPSTPPAAPIDAPELRAAGASAAGALPRSSLPGGGLPPGASRSGASLPGASLAPPPPRAPGVSRALLVLGALCAGAASAALVIFALRALESDADDAVVAAHEPAVDAQPPTPVRAEAGGGGVSRGVDPPAGIEPPNDGEPVAPPADGAEGDDTPEEAVAPESSRRRTRRTTRRAPTEEEPAEDDPGGSSADAPHLPGFGGGARTNPPDPDPPPSTASPLTRARAEQRAGRPLECVRILDEAIRAGSSAIALRRRGDCYADAGDRPAAVRDYQRFCRLVPDHPSISEVRPLLESWGYTCP